MERRVEFHDTFIEVQGLQEVNQVDLSLYTFVAYSDKRGYIFKLRKGIQ